MSSCRGLQKAVQLQLGAIRPWTSSATPDSEARGLSLEPSCTMYYSGVLQPLKSHKRARMRCPNLNWRLLKSPKAPAQPHQRSPPLHSTLMKPPLWPIMDVTSISLPPPPLQLGDLRELVFSNMTPVGAVQAALEFVQVTTGLPWWGTIVLTTMLVRLALVHFAIEKVRTTAAMAPVCACACSGLR
ncbi:hypothetical protein JB92DRAFT_515822 [Gautieria morchelliformis]|nr:hypothetical protein JB92DRAFT_515822 [Gautieria morchelliformis]